MKRVKATYTFLAYLTFNCLLAFVVLNVALALAFWVRDRVERSSTDERVSAYREKFADFDAYTKTTSNEATALLDEQDAMGTVGIQYQPWVQFRNPKVEGKFLNTDSHGYRATTKPASRAGRPLTVHVYGGSTTFGYGVADKDTIPSYLQRTFEKDHPNASFVVRNMGQPFYYSTQEQTALLSMLRAGDVPDWAVFIDGGNDTGQLALQHDEPIFTPGLRRLWNERTGTASAGTGGLLFRLPAGRLVRGLTKRFLPDSSDVDSVQFQLIMSDADLPEAEREQIADYIVTHYLNNLRITRAIAREFGVKTLFVWQPHPAYKYERRLHKRFPFEGPIPDYFTRTYERMEQYRSADFLFLGGLLEGRTEKSYVDDVHYNESVNEQIAAHIARMIQAAP